MARTIGSHPTTTELARAIRRREVISIELMVQALRRIRARNAILGTAVADNLVQLVGLPVDEGFI
ncbi:hypothetical protein [Nocardia sp. CA-290969]|uniref:hypothetical protein n=1 Tax=Nocardia sp. CA-290969 TaxID=3239986 RepID=UPI003D911C95